MNNRATKVYPLFPQTPITQENEENEKRPSESVSDSVSDYYSRACARTREKAEIEQYFCDTFGAAKMPPVAIRQIDVVLERGMEPALIYTAMDEAALAPRPSWAYAAAILRRLMSEKVFTEDDYQKRQAAWRRRRGLDELPF